MQRRWILFYVCSIGVIVTSVFLIFNTKKSSEAIPIPAPSSPAQTTSPIAMPSVVESESTQILRADAITGAPGQFTFSAAIPKSWKAETVSPIEAINIFDPTSAENSNLEKSQIFIRFFEANAFLTLTTVDILKRTETTVNNRPAVQYVIKKKAGVANFVSQPSWRNTEHTVTDIRVSTTNPSIFYVLAKRPDLDQVIYDQFLEDFQVQVDQRALVEPIAEFHERITKKPFGIYITPKNSPVQPEKFTGFHTGVDVEYGNVIESVPVKAIADGTVVLSRSASGYGGVMIIEHTINGKKRLVLYGHLDPKSMSTQNTTVTTGQQIAELGDNESAETDGERKHLHFSVLNKTTVDFKGYVATEQELDEWVNPLDLYK